MGKKIEDVLKKRKYNLNPCREYYVDNKGQIVKKNKPHLLGLFNKKIRFAYAYCKLKRIYLTKTDASEKKCFLKGKDYCKYLYILEGDERINGIKNAEQRRYEGKTK